MRYLALSLDCYILIFPEKNFICLTSYQYPFFDMFFSNIFYKIFFEKKTF